MHSGIFSGQVSHWRKSPVSHSFEYRIFMVYLDLSELDDVFSKRWFWSTKRPALARYHRGNYFGDKRLSLDSAIRDFVAEKSGSKPVGPIRLLTNLSYFGYCFNPISIYYCFDKDDTRVETIVAEVNNTPWGEKHCYILPDNENAGDESVRRFRIDKELHVSPFMSMNMSYHWLLTQPSEDVVVHIQSRSDDDPMFGATLNLKRQEITGPALAGVLVRYPFMTMKIILAIHWQALKLWIKGCPVVPHPGKKVRLEASQ